MPNPALKATIFGAGLMGRVHAEAACAAGGAVHVVADSDAGKAAGLAHEFNAIALTPDEAFKRRGTTIAHICTPPETHAALARRALESGMHVLSEKPLTATAEELEILMEVAEREDLLVCPMHQFPFQNGVMRALKSRSKLGEIRHVAAEICTAGAEEQAHDRRTQLAFDLLPHPLSLVRAFGIAPLGSIEWKSVSSGGGEMVVAGTQKGVVLSFLLSTRGRPTSNRVRVIGDTGTANLDLFHGYSYIERGRVSRLDKVSRPFESSALSVVHALANGARRIVDRETSFPGLRELVRQFYQSVVNRLPSPISCEETLDIARARDLIIASVIQRQEAAVR